jgi:hypothetical protein
VTGDRTHGVRTPLALRLEALTSGALSDRASCGVFTDRPIFLGFFLPELRKPEELKKPGTIKSVLVITYPELGLWPEAHVHSLGSGFHCYLV